MAKFTDIIGQEHIKEHLQNAIRTKKVSHAYIINGERHAGKEFIARRFSVKTGISSPVRNAIPVRRRYQKTIPIL